MWTQNTMWDGNMACYMVILWLIIGSSTLGLAPSSIGMYSVEIWAACVRSLKHDGKGRKWIGELHAGSSNLPCPGKLAGSSFSFGFPTLVAGLKRESK